MKQKFSRLLVIFSLIYASTSVATVVNVAYALSGEPFVREVPVTTEHITFLMGEARVEQDLVVAELLNRPIRYDFASFNNTTNTIYVVPREMVKQPIFEFRGDLTDGANPQPLLRLLDTTHGEVLVKINRNHGTPELQFQEGFFTLEELWDFIPNEVRRCGATMDLRWSMPDGRQGSSYGDCLGCFDVHIAQEFGLSLYEAYKFCCGLLHAREHAKLVQHSVNLYSVDTYLHRSTQNDEEVNLRRIWFMTDTDNDAWYQALEKKDFASHETWHWLPPDARLYKLQVGKRVFEFDDRVVLNAQLEVALTQAASQHFKTEHVINQRSVWEVYMQFNPRQLIARLPGDDYIGLRLALENSREV